MAQESKKIYFLSDIHLGSPDWESSRTREKLLIEWINSIENTAEAIYFVGDIFDFWFEWKRVIPKGFVRFFGKIAALVESGIEIHFFTGNHDVWMFGYFEQELGVILHTDILKTEINGKKFLITHGDALGPRDNTFKVLKKLFTNPTLQKLFALLHPNLAIDFAYAWSHKSRKSHSKRKNFYGEEKEWLVMYSREVLENEYFDYFIYGHRHLPMKYKLTEKSTFINTGDWLHNFSFAEFDGKDMELKYLDKK